MDPVYRTLSLSINIKTPRGGKEKKKNTPSIWLAHPEMMILAPWS